MNYHDLNKFIIKNHYSLSLIEEFKLYTNELQEFIYPAILKISHLLSIKNTNKIYCFIISHKTLESCLSYDIRVKQNTYKNKVDISHEPQPSKPRAADSSPAAPTLTWQPLWLH